MKTGNRAMISWPELLVPTLLLAAISAIRNLGWLPGSWTAIPVVEGAWLNLLPVVAIIAWWRYRGASMSFFGLKPLPPAGVLVAWTAVTLFADTVVTGATKALLVSLLGEPEALPRFADVPGNLPLLLTLLPLIWVIAAFGEELFFRGFLLNGVASLLGGGRSAWGVALVVQAGAFGLIHLYQGAVDALTIGVGALVYGAAFLLAKRKLWPVILAHGINDTVGFVLLYAGAIKV